MAMPELKPLLPQGPEPSGRNLARQSNSAASPKVPSIYPRLSPTSEWDVAAGHAVVTAAGGKMTDSHGRALHFGIGREDFLVPEFIAWGDPIAAD